jgi:mannose-6-phosphate isomerase-like protein (cupin superfamily)|tara:strand:- start:150 stop:1169 length:1020 start_codon:yes stop_codon:yes gene_type:complete
MIDIIDCSRETHPVLQLPVIAVVLGVVIMLQACQPLAQTDVETNLSTTNVIGDRPEFVLWTGLELEQRNAQLSRTIRIDGSSRETLADYLTPSRSHRFRFIRRDRDGAPEQHDNIEDYVYVQSGQGVILVGGQMLGRTGDLGTEIIGGSRYSVGAGDVLRIPAGVPHAYLPESGEHLTYVLVRVPAFRGAVAENPDGQAPALDPSGFGLWRAAELEQRNMTIVERMRPDGSSRATLADYGAGGSSHRLRFIRRDRDGWPELHDDIIDVVFVQSGQGTVLVEGKMIGESNVPGSEIDGGVRFTITAGDVLHIPAKMPHAYLTSPGDHITYVLLRVPGLGN